MNNYIPERDWFEYLYNIVKATRTGPFVEQKFLEGLLLRMNFRKLPKTPFIDYGLALDFYHPDEITKIQLNNLASPHGDQNLQIALPYNILINFITSPDVYIEVNPLTIPKYVMTPEMIKRTENNLAAFRNKNPHTNLYGKILRIASFKQKDNKLYQVSLEHGEYEAQVRTNLTLDYRFSDTEKTLREIDVTEDYRLRSFQDSVMVNSIGVSTVVYFKRNKTKYFFAKIRSSKVAVFPEMLGTVSGVGVYVENMTIRDLLQYAEREILRELRREIGLDYDSGDIKAIYPLAFSRELSRGGKPQFFFLVEAKEFSDRELTRKFRSAPESFEEFISGLQHDFKRFETPMTPEFATNFALSLVKLANMKV